MPLLTCVSSDGPSRLTDGVDLVEDDNVQAGVHACNII